MSEVVIRFETDNAAFEGDFHMEVARVLGEAVRKVVRQKHGDREASDVLMDKNGNTIGHARYER